MICSKCGFDNTEDSKFCTACGAKLEPVNTIDTSDETAAVAEDAGASALENVEADTADMSTGEPEAEESVQAEISEVSAEEPVSEENIVQETATDTPVDNASDPFYEAEQAMTQAANDVRDAADDALSGMTGADRSADESSEGSYYDESSMDYSSLYDTEVGGKLGFAIASLVCGSLSILCCIGACATLPLSIAAIVLGIITLVKSYDGRGFAIAGIATGGVGLVLQIIMMITYAATGVFD